MSGIGVDLHRVLEVCGGSPQNRRGSLVDPESQDRRLSGRRRDSGASRDFEAEDTRRDRKACFEAKRVAVARHASDGATTRIPKVPFEGMYPSIM
jgi:hypothetical protein